MRGWERDQLVKKPEFKRFLKGAEPGGTVYLVCTSAGEVGIDISADHIVCDLSTLESMVQRFGRVNRYGLRAESRIDVVCASKFDDKQKHAREATLKILRRLDGDASPKAVGDLLAQEGDEAFAPKPLIPPATDILFDAWALTSITQPLAGRPPVEPYLHGIESQPPETQVAWREEVGIITNGLLDVYSPEDLLQDYPLLPHELLRDRSDRVFAKLERIASRRPESPVWIMDERGWVQPTTMGRLADKEQKTAIENRTVLLAPSVGGLKEGGLLDGESEEAEDVADAAVDERERPRRQRVWDDVGLIPKGLRVFRIIDTRPDAEDLEGAGSEGPRRLWLWCDRPLEGGRAANRSILWDQHVGRVVERATQIVAGLALPQKIAGAVIVAAKLHDHGKRRKQFQLTLGNRAFPSIVLAKSNGRGAAQFAEPFRHEFASMLDAGSDPEFAALDAEMQELVLHLIGAHHGRGRPHFDPGDGFDPERPSADSERLRFEALRRFAKLQRKYGRWGLAYLESLLRAADWGASAAESEGVA
jgi:CRISPR-associated endonuclease/helicase Cas3